MIRPALLERQARSADRSDGFQLADRELLILLGALLEEVRGLRADLREQRRRPSRRGLLAAIAGAVGDRSFTAREVLDHAEVTPALAEALARGELLTARSLGKYFRVIEGRVVDAVRLARIGVDHNQILWQFEN